MSRRPEFTAHPAAEDFIQQLNDVVSMGEGNIHVESGGDSPLVLVVGAPRSGTTVLMQWLAQVGLAVPSNIAARFSQNPYFAGLIQRLMSDPELNYRDELTVGAQSDQYSSDYGKTVGPLSPHEFSFFFRRFFPVTVGEQLSVEEISRCDVSGFLEGMAHFGAGLAQPTALKALLIQYNLSLFQHAKNVVVVHVHRDEADNTCSLLRHREIVAGDAGEWISVRPPEYEWLRHLSPVEQVAGQVHFTNAAIARQLQAFPGEQVVSISHETFCADPNILYEALSARFVSMGKNPLPLYDGPESFTVRRYDAESDSRRRAVAALDSVKSRRVSGMHNAHQSTE